MDITEGILQRDGTPIYYWAGGKEGAPLVVLTHGATIDHHEWDATLPHIGRHFRFLTWDVRGHGRSKPAHFTLNAAIDDLLALLDTLGEQQAIFLGHSMGGNLHQELVFRHPERVRAMICLGCTWNFQKMTPLESFMMKIARPIFMLYSHKALVNQSLEATTISKKNREFLRESMQSISKAEFIDILMETSACLHYEPGYKINKPLLLIVGDKDPTGNIRKIMPVWAEQESDCRFVIIPKSLHAANLDDPSAFHKAVMDFLLDRCVD